MEANAEKILVDIIDSKAIPLQNDYDELMEKIGEAKIVLMGEASHGTHEFYQFRAALSQQLIAKKKFNAICIEGDWPSVHGFHRYVMGTVQEDDWVSCFSGFNRFPTWMWCNKDIPPFLRWLRTHNESKTKNQKVGFYGLDLYSLYNSMNEVITFLNQIDPAAAKRAKERYACFEFPLQDPQTYGYLTGIGEKKACIEEAKAQLQELQDRLKKEMVNEEDDLFYATQNARLVKDAENYYRSMFESRISTWNIRDTHMADTVQVLENYLRRRNNDNVKLIIWAHNSHVGDARATEMGSLGEINIGQLLRERFPNQTFHIGFSTNSGTVTAADEWDQPASIKRVMPGLEGSYEELFHRCKHKNFFIDLKDQQLQHLLHPSRLQRAIGVIYKPETERMSHYFFTCLPNQFDVLIHFDQTTAVIPLEENNFVV